MLIIIGSSVHLGFNPLSIIQDTGNSLTIIQELFAFDFSVGDKVIASLVETLEMALIGSSVGFALSIPAALLAARNVSPFFISAIFRGFLAILWSMPPLLWAILLVVIVGLGPTAGIFAIALFIMGLSGKYLYEIYESQNISAYDAMHVIGATRMQIAKFVTIPEALPHMSNQYLFLLAYSVRESAILGLVGAGGIGFYIIQHLESLNYGKAAPFILAILLVTLGMDYISTKLRKRLVYH
ncbi:MAG: ABC transporter permease subunit [Candidatus Nitrosotenuis sp.]